MPDQFSDFLGTDAAQYNPAQVDYLTQLAKERDRALKQAAQARDKSGLLFPSDAGRLQYGADTTSINQEYMRQMAVLTQQQLMHQQALEQWKQQQDYGDQQLGRIFQPAAQRAIAQPMDQNGLNYANLQAQLGIPSSFRLEDVASNPGMLGAAIKAFNGSQNMPQGIRNIPLDQQVLESGAKAKLAANALNTRQDEVKLDWTNDNPAMLFSKYGEESRIPGVQNREGEARASSLGATAKLADVQARTVHAGDIVISPDQKTVGGLFQGFRTVNKPVPVYGPPGEDGQPTIIMYQNKPEREPFSDYQVKPNPAAMFGGEGIIAPPMTLDGNEAPAAKQDGPLPKTDTRGANPTPLKSNLFGTSKQDFEYKIGPKGLEYSAVKGAPPPADTFWQAVRNNPVAQQMLTQQYGNPQAATPAQIQQTQVLISGPDTAQVQFPNGQTMSIDKALVPLAKESKSLVEFQMKKALAEQQRQSLMR